MAGRQAEAISAGLVAAGVPATRPAVFVESASLPNRRVVPTRVGALASAARSLGDGPTLLLIGGVYERVIAAAERVDLPLQRTA
jgi:uroporphyrin-III C-methyltransferase